MNNRDRINAMTDEELAKWLCELMDADSCSNKCPARNMCKWGENGMYTWLTSETYKEAENATKI